MTEAVVAVLEFLTGVGLAGGGFFLLVGGIGLHRLPDFYSRLHAGGLTDRLGAGLTLAGLACHALSQAAAGRPGDWDGIVIRLVMIFTFLFFTSPATSYALARAAFTQGLRPRLDDQQFDERMFEGELVTEIDL